MISRARWLAIAILAWTAITWGGRIGLLTQGDDWADVARIGGSLVVGLAAAGVLLFPGRWAGGRIVLYLFSAWTTVVWARSLVVNWAGSGSLAFKLVHTVLGVGFFALAYWAWSLARRGAIAGPDQADGDEERDREASGIA